MMHADQAYQGEHPLYGPFFYNKPYPLRRKQVTENIGVDNYFITLFDSLERPFEIRHASSSKARVISNTMQLINTDRTISVIPAMLCSVFPSILPDETIDHMNDDPRDNRITNLQWMSRSDNSRKGQAKSVESKKEFCKGRPVVMLDESSGSEPVELMRFSSIANAARLVLKYSSNVDPLAKITEEDRNEVKDGIIEACRTASEAHKFFWRASEDGVLMLDECGDGTMVELHHFPTLDEATDFVLNPRNKVQQGIMKACRTAKVACKFFWRASEDGVLMLDERRDGTMVELRHFPTLDEAIDFVLNNGHHLEVEARIDNTSNQIRKAMDRCGSAYAYLWRDIEIPMIHPDEKWVPVPAFITPVEGYQVSSYGQVKNLHKKLMYPSLSRYGKYSSVSFLTENRSHKTKRVYVHILVWAAFNGRLPYPEVLHDDSAPLTPQGYYRNYLEDLREGTRTENMKDFHEAKRKKADIMDEEEILVLPNPGEDRLTLNLLQPGEKPVETTLNFNYRTKNGLKSTMEGKKDKIALFMEKSPVTGIQLNQESGARGLHFVYSRRFTPHGKDIKSSTSKKISERVKFMQILECYIFLKGPIPGVDYSELVGMLSGQDQIILNGLEKLGRTS